MEILSQSLPYIQITLAVILIVIVLLQQSDADLGGAFGGNTNMGTPARTRRGGEKIIFNTTIVVAVLFGLSAFLALIIK